MAINWSVVDPELPYKVGMSYDTGRQMALKDLFDQQSMQIQQQKMANYPRELALNEALTTAKIGELQAHADERTSNAKKRQRVDDLFSKYSSLPDGPERKAVFQELAMVLSPATAFKEPSAPKIEEEWGGTESNPMKRQIVRNADGTVKPVSGWVPMHSKQVVNVGGGTPFFQAIPTPQGIMSFDARSGRIAPVAVDGAPVMKSADSPELQGRIAGAKEQAETDVKSKANAGKAIDTSNQFLAVAKQAQTLLDAGRVTQSGAGALADKVGSFVGYSPESSQNAGKLEALSGWMVSNVPRMEGPQSNFDVQNYMTMAGKVGDRTVPVPERIAALSEVIRLQEKYKHLNQEKVANIEKSQRQQEPTRVPNSAGNTVTTPDGVTHKFPSAAAAAAFRKAAGL